ncbi:hypothetical protein K9M74_05550 [Candidatus Woesearchaeota archaeon]|nr:hypothetical protein [Candidatus Woesearchaeota archaeon]
MEYSIQGHTLELETLLLDLNGTITVRGKLPRGIKRRLRAIQRLGIKIIIISGDQRGTAQQIASRLGVEIMIAKTSTEKALLAKTIPNTMAVGNARIDLGLFVHASLSVATVQGEGIHTAIIPAVDIIVPHINDALDLLLHPDNLEGTLKE